MTLSVVILAAGKGTRMCSELPKVLQPLAKKPLIKYVVDSALSLNPNDISIVIGYRADSIKSLFSQSIFNWPLQKEQLGTGHALLQAAPYIHGDITLILYGDVPLIDAKELNQLVGQTNGGISIMTFDKEHPAGYGRIVRKNNRICAIVEDKDCTSEERKITEINTGIMAVDSNQLKLWLKRLSNNNQQKEYYLTDIVKFAAEDNVEISSYKALNEITISGINSKSELAMMERAYQMSLANKLMDEGVTLVDPSRIDIRGQLVCGKDVIIDVGCVFEDKVILGDGVHVKAYSILKNCEIKENTVIEPFSHIDASVVGHHNKIGPYARLRPGSTLADNVHIGNFVELKNTVIGEGTKINHLSYIGDTEIGSNVNVGAGTITCNYDGANKHKTIIESDVFVGSDTQLIAPVKIGQGATIGAGSTITQDVPADKLTLSRTEQKTVSDWKRPTKK